MGKDFLETVAPFAAMAALPVLGPGAAGAAGSGLLGSTPFAAPAMGAFGSANMLAAGAAGMPALGATAAGAAGAATASSALPAMSDDLIANGLWDGVGQIPNQIESVKGLDFINGVPQNFGAGVEQFTNNLFDGGFKMPSFGQQKQQRPAAIANQVKPVGRNAQESQPSTPGYGQSSLTQDPINARQDLTPKQMWQLQMLRAMGRI